MAALHKRANMKAHRNNAAFLAEDLEEGSPVERIVDNLQLIEWTQSVSLFHCHDGSINIIMLDVMLSAA
jgi:hypothetical protein